MNEIKKKYIDMFFSDLTNKDKKDIYFNQYMWHAYSYKKLEALEGFMAIDAFKKCNQDGVYIFFEHNDEVIKKGSISFEELLDSLKIWSCSDCYIVDREFKWAFIYTHETCYDENEIIDSNLKHNNYYIGPFFVIFHKNY